MKKREKIIGAFIVSGMVLLTGCGLFPEEAQIDDTLMVAHYTPVKQAMVKVERGNLDFSETINLTYSCQESRDYYLKYNGRENLSIKIYVVKGDVVKKGQLLAEAPCEEIEKEIAGYQQQISSLQLGISYNQSLLKLAEEDEEKNGCRAAIRDGKAQIEVLQIRIKEAEDKLSGYRIYADMDGQVTYIVDLMWEQYDQAKPFLRMSSTEGYFTGTTAAEGVLLKTGDVVTAEISGEACDLTVQNIEEAEAGQVNLFFATQSRFEEGEKGKLILSGEQAENVLYIPAEAVAVEGDKAYVRIPAQDGFPRAKEITVSSLINGYYVVERGLEEGEEIINE